MWVDKMVNFDSKLFNMSDFNLLKDHILLLRTIFVFNICALAPIFALTFINKTYKVISLCKLGGLFNEKNISTK